MGLVRRSSRFALHAANYAFHKTLPVTGAAFHLFCRLFHRPLAIIFDVLEWVINHIIQWKSRFSTNVFYHRDVHAPVKHEVFAQNLVVNGELPKSLEGEFVRNGANPAHTPTGGYHWFDGDGMLHGVRLKDGVVSYVNRYVKTRRLAEEDRAGQACFVKIGDLQAGIPGLLKMALFYLRPLFGVEKVKSVPLDDGTANTALVLHARRLFALVESAVPYEISLLEDGRLETIGRYDYGGKLRHAFTAHPKVDATTGEMFTYGVDIQKAPHLHYSVINAKSDLVSTTAIQLPEPVMMHDFAITEHYAIFMDLPLVFRKAGILKGDPAFVFDRKKAARFGIMPRYATQPGAVRWFRVPPCFIFHTANAWEDGQEVVYVGPSREYFNLSLQDAQSLHCPLVEFRFNMSTGATKVTPIEPAMSVEFPTIHPALVGRKARYTYCAMIGEERDLGGPGLPGVIKYDLQTRKIVARRVWGQGRGGGECVFVPRDKQMDKLAEEDAGHLLTFVFNAETKTSEFVVLDAKDLSQVASVAMPQRVPSGFHGIWVDEEELQAMYKQQQKQQKQQQQQQQQQQTSR